MTRTVTAAGLTVVVDDAWSPGHHDGRSDGWAHHGIAVTSTGEVVTVDEYAERALVIHPGGEVLKSFPLDVVEAHALLVTRRAGGEWLWICDTGSKQRRQASGEYRASPKPLRGAVVLTSLTGVEIGRLPIPPLAVYADGDYCPGAIAVDEVDDGGSGDVWVADCYGQSLLHRFDTSGRYLATSDGTCGAGRFHHPHALLVDRRGDEPVLLVADRGHRRIQVHRLDGTFVRSIGEDHLLSPGALAVRGDLLLVGELHGRIVVIDRDDALVGVFGPEQGTDVSGPAWPNGAGPDGPVRPALEPGRLHTPHGIAVHPDGSVYVSEWLIGGRLLRLGRP